MGSETAEVKRVYPPEAVAALRPLLAQLKSLEAELGEMYTKAHDYLAELQQKRSAVEIRIATLENVLYAFSVEQPKSADVYEY